MSDMTDKEKQEQIEQAAKDFAGTVSVPPRYDYYAAIAGFIAGVIWQQQGQLATLSDATLNALIRDLLDYDVGVDHADIDEMRRIARKHLKI